MDNALKVILEKLDQIEKRIKKLEGIQEKPTGKAHLIEGEREKKEKDPLFDKAWQIILQTETDLSARDLAQKLNIDIKRAEIIMDQLQEAGLGMVYEKEV